MSTPHTLTAQRGRDDLAVALADADIPVLTGTQRQGDVLLLPCPLPVRWPRTGPAPLNGVAVATSELTGHTHALYGDGQVLLTSTMTYQRLRWWQPDVNTLGWLRVPAGGQAFLMHSGDHDALGIGPGTYQILQQQEFNRYVMAWLPADD